MKPRGVNPVVDAALRERYLVRLSDEHWPAAPEDMTPPVEVWLSRKYLVQVYETDTPGVVLMSVNRPVYGPAYRTWVDGLSWDDLQRAKREVGRGDCWAVEVYPADGDVVNVANMRHLWLLPERPAFAWQAAA